MDNSENVATKVDAAEEKTVQEAPDFRPYIPKEFEGEKFWEQVKDLPTLLQNYAHAQKLIGRAVVLPGKDAKPEEWDKVYQKLGRPEKPEDYQLQIGQPLADAGFSEDDLKAFLPVFHKLGLSQSQAQALLDHYGEYLGKNVGNVNTELAQAFENLRKEWGPNYERRMQLAARVVKQFGDDAIQEFFLTDGKPIHPMLARLLARIGESLREHDIIQGDIPPGLTVDRAKEEWEKISANKNHPYWNAADMGHKDAVEYVSKLFAVMAGR